MILWSIDPGTETGLAVWDVLRRRLLRVETTTQLRAIFDLRDALEKGVAFSSLPDLVMVEDSRKMRIGRGKDPRARFRLKGVGSVNRSCVLWQDALELLAVPYVMLAPAIGLTKLTAEQFAGLTGWTGRTSSHARDAAMRAYSMNAAQVRAMIEEWRQRYLAARQPRRRKGAA